MLYVYPLCAVRAASRCTRLGMRYASRPYYNRHTHGNLMYHQSSPLRLALAMRMLNRWLLRYSSLYHSECFALAYTQNQLTLLVMGTS